MKIFLFCPVPENQKPINEFLNIQENSSINWVGYSKKEYDKQILVLFVFVFFTFFFLFYNSFQQQDLFSFVFKNLVQTNIALSCMLFFIFFRWFQLEKRLNDSRLFYEEGSWYDGQIWEKPLIIIKNDRLITSQKLKPILRRLINQIVFFFFYYICNRNFFIRNLEK